MIHFPSSVCLSYNYPNFKNKTALLSLVHNSKAHAVASAQITRFTTAVLGLD